MGGIRTARDPDLREDALLEGSRLAQFPGRPIQKHTDGNVPIRQMSPTNLATPPFLPFPATTRTQPSWLPDSPHGPLGVPVRRSPSSGVTANRRPLGRRDRLPASPRPSQQSRHESRGFQPKTGSWLDKVVRTQTRPLRSAGGGIDGTLSIVGRPWRGRQVPDRVTCRALAPR